MFKTGPIFVFLRIQPLARVLGSLRGSVYSLHTCTIPFSPSPSSVMKYCPLSTVLHQRWNIVWSSDSCSELMLIFWQQVSPSLLIGPRVDSWRFGTGFPSSPKDHVLLVSSKPWYLWIPPCTNLILLRRY